MKEEKFSEINLLDIGNTIQTDRLIKLFNGKCTSEINFVVAIVIG